MLMLGPGRACSFYSSGSKASEQVPAGLLVRKLESLLHPNPAVILIVVGDEQEFAGLGICSGFFFGEIHDQLNSERVLKPRPGRGEPG